MEDDQIKLRKTQEKPLTKESWNQETLNRKLSLRKTNLDEYIASKRKISSNVFKTGSINITSPFSLNNTHKDEGQEVNSIKIEDLSIPSNFEIDLNKFYANFNIDFISDYITSPNINLRKYGIVILRKYMSMHETSDKQYNDKCINLATSMSQNWINVLCWYLTQCPNDPDMLYEINWIWINWSFCTEGETKITDNEANLENIMNYLANNINSPGHVNWIIWLLSHLCSRNIVVKKYLLSHHIFDVIPMIYEKYSSDGEIVRLSIKVLNNITQTTLFPEYYEEYMKVIPLWGKGIHYNNANNIQYWLDILYKLSLRVEWIDSLLESGIDTKWIYWINEIKSKNALSCLTQVNEQLYFGDILLHIKRQTMKIICNLLFGSDVQTQRVIQNGVLAWIKSMILEEDLLLIKYTIWGVNNIAGGTIGQVSWLLSSNIIYDILDFTRFWYTELNTPMNSLQSNKEKYEVVFDLYRVICTMCSMVCLGLLSDNLITLLSYNNNFILWIIADSWCKYQMNDAVIMKTLEVVYKIYILEQNMEQEFEELSYINILKNHNVIENLEKLQMSPNAEIAQQADVVYSLIIDGEETHNYNK